MSTKAWLGLFAAMLVALALAGWIASGIRWVIGTTIGLPLRLRQFAAGTARI